MAKSSLYFIDHYDSFSFNVVNWLVGKNSELSVVHIQYDDIDGMQKVLQDPKPLVISPGPRHPLQATSTISIVQNLLGRVPIMGICLGHQILGAIGGFNITHACSPFHGSAFSVDVVGSGLLFENMPESFMAATYNSLIVSGAAKDPSSWQIDAINSSGEIQGLSWNQPGKWPAFGLQFHPESFLTEYQEILRSNWLTVVNKFDSSLGTVCDSAITGLPVPVTMT